LDEQEPDDHLNTARQNPFGTPWVLRFDTAALASGGAEHSTTISKGESA
jgi:hypothetical protein